MGKSNDFKFLVICFTISVTLSLSSTTKQDLDYNQYIPLGQKRTDDLVIIRVKRDTVDSKAEQNPPSSASDDSNNAAASSDSNNKSTGGSSPSLSSSISESDSSTKQQVPEGSVSDVTDSANQKGRGWHPPENATTVLKEIDENQIDLEEKKIVDKISEAEKNEGFKNQTDEYKYYKQSQIPFEQSWIDLERWNGTVHPGIVVQHTMLSKSYRRAATISLKFKFPFYGHMVENITIATGGFLYLGDYVHSWLAATQYIAPLMANFDTSQMDNATVRYADNGTTLVVEWGNVHLQARDGDQTGAEGPFTFQAILHQNGDIVFAYKSIPVSIMTIADEEHPVKVGLSDAYIIERTIFFVRRKTIYEYHRVDMRDLSIANHTAIYITALPRCNMKTNCKECLATTVTEANGEDQECMWCDSARLCSDGYDRNKQNWLKNNCDKTRNNIKGSPETCDTAASVSHMGNRDYNPSYNVDDAYDSVDHDHHDHMHGHDEESDHFKDSKSNVHHTGVALLIIVIILIFTICGWCLYAYFFPHTCSGQLLIKYRPTRWHWRRGEPRYTAASIHM